MFSFFSENKLISPKQSSFRRGDSCTNQLRSIAHEILSTFYEGHEVRGVFLDISKAFDRVWYECLPTFVMGWRTSRVNFWSFTIFNLH